MSQGVYRYDYFVSIDMAKELSMVERNDKGKEARVYFIHARYFKVTERVIKTNTEDMISPTTYITGKGQIWLSKKLESWK